MESKQIKWKDHAFSMADDKVTCTDLWPVQVLGLSIGWFVPLELLREGQDGAHKPEHTETFIKHVSLTTLGYKANN